MKKSAVRILVVTASVAVLATAFQNCGLRNAFTSESIADVNAMNRPDPAIKNADIGWSTRAETYETDSFNRVGRWFDLTGNSLPLYPPIRGTGAGLDMEKSGVLTRVLGQPYIALAEEASLQPAMADIGDFVSDRYSVAFVVRDLVVPPSGVVRLFRLGSINGDNIGELVLDAHHVNGVMTLTVNQFFGDAGYGYKQIALTEEQLKAPIAIAIRFDKEASNLQMAINGALVPGEVTFPVSQPPQLGLAARGFKIHATGEYGSVGSFLIGEFGVYRKSLADTDLIAASAGLYSRWSGIVVEPTATPVPSPTPFVERTGAQIYAVSCASCHGSLANSAKKRTTITALNNSITTVDQMAGLGSLTAAERQKVVEALQIN